MTRPWRVRLARILHLLVARAALQRRIREAAAARSRSRRYGLWLGPGRHVEGLSWDEVLRVERQTRWGARGLVRP